jgi:hypothetical protein
MSRAGQAQIKNPLVQTVMEIIDHDLAMHRHAACGPMADRRGGQEPAHRFDPE